jgi:hypothetical protein
MHHASSVPQARNTFLRRSRRGTPSPAESCHHERRREMIRAHISLPGFTIRSAKRDRLKRKVSRLQHQAWRSLARRARLDYGAVKLKGSSFVGACVLNSRQPLVLITYAIADDAQTVKCRYHSGVKASEFLIVDANELRASCRAWAFIAFLPVAADRRSTSASTQPRRSFRLRLSAVDWDRARTGEPHFVFGLRVPYLRVTDALARESGSAPFGRCE